MARRQVIVLKDEKENDSSGCLVLLLLPFFLIYEGYCWVRDSVKPLTCSIESSALISEYKENEAKAALKYDNKRILVSGQIEKIEKTSRAEMVFLTNDYIIIKFQESDYKSVKCIIKIDSEKTANDIIRLGDNQRVYVTGILDENHYSSFDLERCELLSPEDARAKMSSVKSCK